MRCGMCGKDAVICDAANIEYNNNMMRGLCLNCGEYTIVYKCPSCGRFFNMKLEDEYACSLGIYKLEE